MYNSLKWLANIVLGSKKDGRVRMCIEFKDINKADPKEDVPLLHINIMINSATMANHVQFL